MSSVLCVEWKEFCNNNIFIGTLRVVLLCMDILNTCDTCARTLRWSSVFTWKAPVFDDEFVRE